VYLRLLADPLHRRLREHIAQPRRGRRRADRPLHAGQQERGVDPGDERSDGGGAHEDELEESVELRKRKEAGDQRREEDGIGSEATDLPNLIRVKLDGRRGKIPVAAPGFLDQDAKIGRVEVSPVVKLGAQGRKRRGWRTDRWCEGRVAKVEGGDGECDVSAEDEDREGHWTGRDDRSCQHRRQRAGLGRKRKTYVARGLRR
jgi:hypothetical protein